MERTSHEVPHACQPEAGDCEGTVVVRKLRNEGVAGLHVDFWHGRFLLACLFWKCVLLWKLGLQDFIALSKKDWSKKDWYSFIKGDKVAELLLLRTRLGVNVLHGNSLETHLDDLASKLIHKDPRLQLTLWLASDLILCIRILFNFGLIETLC